MIAALCLCGLGVWAVGVAGAQGAELTAYVCTAQANGLFEGEHCQTETPGGEGDHETVAIGASTEFEGNSEGTASLKATVAAVVYEITCTAWGATGRLGNVNGPPMTATSNDTVIAFSGCTTDNPPGCEVAGEGFTTAPLHSEALAGEAHTVAFRPLAGALIAKVKLEGCETMALDATYSLTGEFTASALGSMLSTSGTAGGKLKFAGQVAQLSATGSLYMALSTETIALETR
jgi:hypothetical protein